MTESPFEFTDKRRIDPETGEPREANAETPADADADVDIQVPDDASSITDAAPEADEVTTLTQALGERTADLQRLQAEYVNYKRRVDRDRHVARQRARGGSAVAHGRERSDTSAGPE